MLIKTKKTPINFTKRRPTWSRALVFSVLALAFITWGVGATAVAQANNTPGSADNSSIERTVTFTSGDFAADSSISDVNISVSFEKLDGTCPTHEGGWAFNREIYAFLTSPSGTQVALIEDNANHSGSDTGYTYTSNEIYGGNVTVLFDDSATVSVGGQAPADGSFRPIEPLSAFVGEDPIGEWVLTMGDSTADDPVCFYEYTLTIEADQQPVVVDQTFSVAENSSNGTVVGTVAATDPDAGDKLTYAITAGNSAGVFTINDATGQITVADGSQLDYETTQSYMLTVQVTDSSGFQDTATVTINVTNANEVPTDITLDDSSVLENEPIGTAVGTFSTTDIDESDTHTYSLIDNATYPDNTSFTIDSDQLKTAVSFDHEAKSSYSIRVQTDDGHGGTLDEEFTITIGDANDAPTDISLDNNSVTEHQSVGTAVGAFSSTDQDSSDSHTYVLTDTVNYPDNASFSISGSQLETAVEFDFDVKQTYTINVQSNDGHGGTFRKELTINVTDGNDPPTDISLSNNSVAENQMAGTAVGSFSTTDPNGSDTHSYSLVSGTGSDNNASFQISGNELQTSAVFDEETKSNYTIRVRSTDNGGLWIEEIFAITITDSNDAPTDISLTNSSVDENEVAGTAVGTFSSSDQDTGDTHTYSLVTGTGDTGNGSFQIDGSQLKTNASFNREAQASYSIRVQTDDGHGGTFAEIFTITITNVNENPTNITLSSSSVSENSPAGTAVANLGTTDPDSGDTFTYALVDGSGSTGNDFFQISSGQLQTLAIFNHEVQESYSIRLQTSDSGGLTFEKEFTITITDVNDVPVAKDDNEAVDEDHVLNVAANGVLANDTDEDGDVLTVFGADSFSALGANVNAAINGGFSYDPTAVAGLQALNVGENVIDTFTYEVIDGGILFDTAVVSVTVIGLNDLPVANDDVVKTVLETAVIVSPLSNDTDPDKNDSMTITGFTQGTHGAVTNNGDGTLTYTPAEGYVGSDSFTYTIEDNHDGSDTAVVNVTVDPEISYVYLPLVLNNYATAPDLVITSLSGSSDYVEVVVKNQGTQATSSGFWVDFYVNPMPPPVAANELWPTLSPEGIAWGVTTSIAVGEVLTLTYSTATDAANLYYSAADSFFSGSLPADTPIYAQVDSAHVGHPNGAVIEEHELTGDTYNNIFQSVATAVPPTHSTQYIKTILPPAAVLPQRH